MSLSWNFLAALLGVYCLLVTYSLFRVPIPGVNEPHYLCKAKHFWNPNWCAGDFFLESSNPHLVFYVTFGWLTEYFSLDTVAIIGRIFGLIPLAVGWHQLCWKLTRNQWNSLLSVSIFFVLQSAGNWSGEWLVGGIESKVIAYGFLLWSIAQALDLKIPSSALLAGLAISFHPVVGVWGTLAAIIATLVLAGLTKNSELCPAIPALKSWGLAVVLFCVAAAPGLISAGQAVLAEHDPESTRIANLLQVGHRLGHHLDPMRFPKEAYRYFGILIFIWMMIRPKYSSIARSRWWNSIVLGSIFIAASGVMIGWGERPLKEMADYEWKINALKFYPFRLADLMVPIAVSLATASCIIDRLYIHLKPVLQRVLVLSGLIGLLCWAGISIPGSDQNPSKMEPEKRQNWISTCGWIQKNTAPEALVYSFDNKWAVKWFCARPEYVNFKDCPQDAASIIEWNQRRWLIARWKRDAVRRDGIRSDELIELSQKTNVSVFICDRFGPIHKTPHYQNKDFRVYLVEGPELRMSSAGND